METQLLPRLQAPNCSTWTTTPTKRATLATDPAFAGVRAELTDRVLDGWDPEGIRQRMRVLKSEQQILESWAAKIDPPDSLRWDLKPEMDYLEPDR